MRKILILTLLALTLSCSTGTTAFRQQAAPVPVQAQAAARSVAKQITGRVVAIADGDTLTVLDSANTQHRVRLQGIDAPESRQAFGTRSRQHLADLVFDKQVTVEYEKKDRYGRTLGKVMAGGADACLEQIRAGMAWHYKYYEREQPPEDRRAYAGAEREARAARRGLWADPNPVPPWDFRRGGRAAAGAGEPPAGESEAPSEPTSAPRRGNAAGVPVQELREDTVFITRTGAKYHRLSCRYLRRSRIPVSLKDAKGNGYTPCSVCRPQP